jgi:DNA-binding transcriptional ArsR family regulator
MFSQIVSLGGFQRLGRMHRIRLAGRSEQKPRPSAAVADLTRGATIRKMKSILLLVDRQPTPPLLPILRSQQQGEILALLLGDPDLELSLTEIATRLGVPHPSVYREIQRAEQAGLVTSRKIGNTRLVRANTASPYYSGLAEVLTRAFGVPAVLAEALRDVGGITAVYIYGSWAARHEGQAGPRPVGDIDVLILGGPGRDQLYAALSTAEQRLARPVQATIRDSAWLKSGSGSFHDTITSRPLVELAVPAD